MTASTGTARRRIYLMRHAHVDYMHPKLGEQGGVTQVHLTDHGRVQAQAAAEILHDVHFDRAICSGLPRTEQTATIVLDCQTGTPPQLEHWPDLHEVHGGKPDFKNMTPEERGRSMLDSFKKAAEPGARFLDGGEPFEGAYHRCTKAIEFLLCQPDWVSALVVAHEGINRLLLGWASGTGLSGAAVFEQDLACVNVIDIDMKSAVPDAIERAYLKAVNITAYNLTKNGMTRSSLETIFDKV